MEKEKDHTGGNGLDKRLGAPMKKSEGLSSDKKRAEHEHLHAFREDIPSGGHQDGDDAEKEDEEGAGE